MRSSSVSAASESRGRAGSDPPEWLSDRDDVDVEDWRNACAGLTLDHMGRSADDDPQFFAAAFAAGRLARGLIA